MALARVYWRVGFRLVLASLRMRESLGLRRRAGRVNPLCGPGNDRERVRVSYDRR